MRSMEIDQCAGLRRTYRAIRVIVDLVNNHELLIEWEIQESPLEEEPQNDSDEAAAVSVSPIEEVTPTPEVANDLPPVQDDPYDDDDADTALAADGV